MGISRVIIPNTATSDFDFLAFSFNGLHSYDDFGLYRTSDGDRYNKELTPMLTEITADSPSADGMYYFNTFHKQRVFNINFAFDELEENTLRKLRNWLNGKEQGDLWFEEEPYKVYIAKVTGQPTIKYIPFEKKLSSGTKRVYRGEGSVQFTAYWPYAHTPDYVGGGTTVNGKDFDSYNSFRNKNEWKIASGLYVANSVKCRGENLGDIPAPFKLVVNDNVEINEGMYVKVGDLTIQLGETIKGLQWDSKTGIVSGIIGTSARRPILVTGNTIGGIPTSTITTSSDVSTASRCSVKIYQNANTDNTKDYRINEYGYWQRYNAELTTEEKWETTGSMPYLQYHYWYY